MKHFSPIPTNTLRGIWSIPALHNNSEKLSIFWGGLCLKLSSWKMKRPLLKFWEKYLRRVSIGAKRKKIIVLANKQRLVSNAWQGTVIHIIPLIGLTLWTVRKYARCWWKRLWMVMSTIGCLMLLITKHSVERGLEGKYLNIKNFKYNCFCDFPETIWIKVKTFMQYAWPFVPNKKWCATCKIHALGCYFACGTGLFRIPDKDGKINPYLIPHIEGLVSINVSGCLIKAIWQYFPDDFTKEYSKYVSSVSLRI